MENAETQAIEFEKDIGPIEECVVLALLDTKEGCSFDEVVDRVRALSIENKQLPFIPGNEEVWDVLHALMIQGLVDRVGGRFKRRRSLVIVNE